MRGRVLGTMMCYMVLGSYRWEEFPSLLNIRDTDGDVVEKRGHVLAKCYCKTTISSETL